MIKSKFNEVLLNTADLLANRCITESAATLPYLNEGKQSLKDILVKQDGVREIFCEYFTQREGNALEYFENIIQRAKPIEDPTEDEYKRAAFRLTFNRLTKDSHAASLFDWIEELGNSTNNSQTNGEKSYTLVVHKSSNDLWGIRVGESKSSRFMDIADDKDDPKYKYYNSNRYVMALHTERHKIIPRLIKEYDMVYRNPNQKRMAESSINDLFGRDVPIIMTVKGKSEEFKLELIFTYILDIWVRVYGEEIDALYEHFKDSLYKRKKKKNERYVELKPIKYQLEKDIENIKDGINAYIKKLKEF